MVARATTFPASGGDRDKFLVMSATSRTRADAEDKRRAAPRNVVATVPRCSGREVVLRFAIQGGGALLNRKCG
jgi:hypothetical protein